LGLTSTKEAHHSEGLDLAMEGIGIGLEVLEFVNRRIYKKRRDLLVFLSSGEILAMACSLHFVFLSTIALIVLVVV